MAGTPKHHPHPEKQPVTQETLDHDRQRQDAGFYETRFRTIIEKNADGMILIDKQGIVRFVNPAALQMFDRREEEFQGEAFGFPVVAGETTEINIIRRDGKNLVAEMRVVETEWDGIPVSLATFRDITERKQAEALQLMRFQVTTILSQSQTIHEAFPPLLQTIGEHMQWEAGEVWLVDQETQLLRWHSCWQSPILPLDDLARTSKGMTLNADTHGIYGEVWNHGQPVWVTNIADHPAFPNASLLIASGMTTAMVFPIPNDCEVIGIVVFFSRAAHHPETRIIRLMTDLCSQIGQFLVRKRAEEDLRHAHRALKTLNEVNQALIHATDEAMFLRDICRTIVGTGGYHMAWAGLLEPNDPGEGRIRVIAGAGCHADHIELLTKHPTGREADDPVHTVVTDHQPSIARNIFDDPAHGALREHAMRWGYAAFVTLPLMLGETILGVLSIYAKEADAFGSEEIHLLMEMANDLSYGISTLRTRAERDRAEYRLRLYAERLKHMREIDQAILTAQNPDAIARAVLRHLRRLVPYQWASIIGYELEAEQPITEVVDITSEEGSFAPPNSHALSLLLSEVINEQPAHQAAVCTYIEDLEQQPRCTGAREQLLAAGIRSCLGVPFVADGQVIGGMSLASTRPKAFDEQHVLIVREVADQLAVAMHQARLFEQVRGSRERLQILYRRLMEGQETERHHIARELHDEIGQSLTAVKMSLQAIQHLSEARGATEISAHLQESIAIVDHSLQRVRNLSLDLRPSLLDDLGLVAALRWYVDRQAQWAGITAEFIAEPEGLRLPNDLETVCFRVTQEALTNVVRHARAHHVHIALRKQDNEVSLTISDDGIGFDVHAAQKRAIRGSSLGLIGMQERVFLAGGEIEIVSKIAGGTSVRVRFPLQSNGRQGFPALKPMELPRDQSHETN